MTQHAPLIIDVAGLRLHADDRRRLLHPLVGGIILFARNWRDRAQLSALCEEIKAVDENLLICVDHEGGRVQRFRTDGFTHLPPMRALGEIWLQEGGMPGAHAMEATNAATACGYVLGAELRACGVDLSFTPVLDLDYGESSVIGDRAFSRDARVTALLAKSLMQGLLQSGMANCGKHFPGHGFVKADSHVDIPVDRRSLKAILADDAAPYHWLNTSLTSVMPAHVIYPKVDARPAGFSTKWLNGILRGQLGFGGAIFSDDLSMAGARLIDGQEVSYSEAAVAALNAGCDMVLLCNQSVDGGAAVDDLINGLTEAQLKGRWQPEEASEARRLALLPKTPMPDWDALMVQPAYMHALGLIP
ncbi:MAG: beta-N-acetylhexosaminidase [Gammaproteobacteria bacterium]|nr:beta-N-acetylhexosaminidase [Gammaproteobacteria bacterium]MBU0788569.1 beta-N-acetylhexosaminidase [Gammaproteobacteria bacterium]MBU0815607.1 beta-N-acetylhexosaminidase [Gammaproteobacteria bacterium]MBU1788185.1 beta-N-acetylhexosaminidase [Gammaproteobacteria bacterium]